MFFSEEFIASVEENPIIGIVNANKMVLKRLGVLNVSDEWGEEEHELLWETASFIQLILQANELKDDFIYPEASANISENCSALKAYIVAVNDHYKAILTEQAVKLKIETYKNRYKNALKGAFAYELSQGDLDRIQLLVNELRTQISENQYLENGHKQRLLKRMENLQSEIHKKVSASTGLPL